ncbi:Sulfite reductase [NADPH] flavoprotein alpha-component [Thalassocella blandensis]|nr:Sulfite reductase [NADPH] flavoprotein alpha-component [Thalassocella blandensis]
MANIRIFVGSVMGTATGVAATAQAILEGYGHHVSIDSDLTQQPLNSSDIVLVCTSNTGMGDLPHNIVPFYSELTQNNPAITGMRYGVINLGDSSYMNFAEAGKLLDQTLEDMGAVRIGEPLILDAIYVDDHEEEAGEWIEQWQALINQ